MQFFFLLEAPVGEASGSQHSPSLATTVSLTLTGRLRGGRSPKDLAQSLFFGP